MVDGRSVGSSTVALFSVVVPAYNVQAYLRAAIMSVLEQDFDDVEVVAVDDCSPDNSGLIIDELAARDPRVKAVHLSENVGLGGARNAGVAAATGDYIVFLDGDDTLTPGALAALADRILTNDRPELCIYNYARTWWDGRVAVSWGAEQLAALSAGTFVPRDHKELFNLLPIACSKAYRRDLLDRLDAHFGEGFYEDVPFTYLILTQARSAVTLNRVVLDYRQRRESGSILRTPSPKHFDVFMQYDKVFEQFDRDGIGPELRRHVYDIMINHYVTIISKPDRIAKSQRQQFFDASKESARKHWRDDVPGENTASAIRGRLLRDGTYSSFVAYQRTDKARRKTKRAIGKVYWPTRRTLRKARAVGRMVYPVLRLMPIDDNLVVFSEYWGTGYGCNPRAIFEKLPEVAPHLVPVWVISEEKGRSLPAGTRQVRPTHWKRWPYFARAKYFVNNVNFPGTYVKRPGQVHIQTMHGTPLKLVGLDVLDSSAASVAVDPVREPTRSEGRVIAHSREQVISEFEKLLTRSDRWDYAISSNPYSTETWSRAYPCRYQWLEVGYPRNDALVRATGDDSAAARATLGIPEGATTVLYAPTFRESPGDVSVRIDVARVIEQLPEDIVLIVRAHHTATAGEQVRRLIKQGRVIDGSSVPDIVTCYLAADVLLTDYSSTMFDYALLDRPIVIYADDWLTYKETRGVEFDLLAEPPGPVARNERELVEILRDRLFAEESSTTLRAAFRDRFCVFDRGDAAAEVIRRVMLPGSPSR